MMPMEDLPNGAQSSEDVPDEAKNPPETSAPSNCCKLLNCCGKTEQQGISRNKIEPVIFQPINDVYLQLKPNRRIRVIHLNGQGALPTSNPYYLQPHSG